MLHFSSRLVSPETARYIIISLTFVNCNFRRELQHLQEKDEERYCVRYYLCFFVHIFEKITCCMSSFNDEGKSGWERFRVNDVEVEGARAEGKRDSFLSQILSLFFFHKFACSPQGRIKT